MNIDPLLRVTLMQIRLKSLISALMLATAASVVALGTPAEARPTSRLTRESNTIPDVFVQEFFTDTGDYYYNREFFRQASWILGVGPSWRNTFPENEIARDGRRVRNLYYEVLNQQVSSDPVIRTRDLPSPYNTSVMSMPSLSP